MKTLLLAEHHAPTREHLLGVLALAGYRVKAVGDAAAAVETFNAERPSAVVIAADFPKLGTSHVGSVIRAAEGGARVQLIVIDHGHLGRAKGVASILELKANAYIADPLKKNVLVERLAAVLASESPAPAATPPRGLALTLSRHPAYSGELKPHPLPAFLQASFRLERDGVLVVTHRELTRRVFLVRGRPAHYDSTARQDSFPRFLVESGKLTEALETRVQAALSGGLRIGAALLEAGVELGDGGGEELLQLLRDYTREKVVQVIGMREGRFAFFAGDEFLAGLATVEIPALAPLLEGSRRSLPLKAFAGPLVEHLDAFPSRTAEFSRDLPALGLDKQDLKIAMQINGRARLRDLLAHGRGDLRDAYSLFWFLSLAGVVAFAKSPPDSALPDQIVPRRRKPLPAEIATSLREGAVNVIAGSYFKVLGLPITADTEAVESAYREIASKYHADAWAEYDLSDLQDLLDSVQEKLTAAYRVLSVKEKRKAYLGYLLSRLDAGRVAAINTDAEIALKRGETALRRGDLTTAILSFERAIELNPREPEYYSYLAWATFRGGKGSREDRGKSAQKVLKKALSLNPHLERASIILAIIEMELGDSSAARKRLVKVLENNPRSQLAKAALRRAGRP